MKTTKGESNYPELLIIDLSILIRQNKNDILCGIWCSLALATSKSKRLSNKNLPKLIQCNNKHLCKSRKRVIEKDIPQLEKLKNLTKVVFDLE